MRTMTPQLIAVAIAFGILWGSTTFIALARFRAGRAGPRVAAAQAAVISAAGPLLLGLIDRSPFVVTVIQTIATLTVVYVGLSRADRVRASEPADRSTRERTRLSAAIGLLLILLITAFLLSLLIESSD